MLRRACPAGLNRASLADAPRPPAQKATKDDRGVRDVLRRPAVTSPSGDKPDGGLVGRGKLRSAEPGWVTYNLDPSSRVLDLMSLLVWRRTGVLSSLPFVSFDLAGMNFNDTELIQYRLPVGV